MSAKTMKGKQAILRYLETHRTFTAKDVSTECGMTIRMLSIWSGPARLSG